MSAKDLYHNNVVNALVKDGWTITDDPLNIQFLNVDLRIDFGAKRNGEKIAIIVKELGSSSIILDFHEVLGEYLSCLEGIVHSDPTRSLYLAIPSTAYRTLLQLRFSQHMIRKHQIQLAAYDPETEQIIEWFSPESLKDISTTIIRPYADLKKIHTSHLERTVYRL